MSRDPNNWLPEDCNGRVIRESIALSEFNKLQSLVKQLQFQITELELMCREAYRRTQQEKLWANPVQYGRSVQRNG